jgi:hypothetical protein
VDPEPRRPMKGKKKGILSFEELDILYKELLEASLGALKSLTQI